MIDSRPILVDALHICMGGGLMILNHLVNHLVQRNVNFLLLKDERCPKLQSEDKIKNIEVLPASFRKRRNYYKVHRNDFKSVLCFGNIPPYIKLPVPVHTYIHNVSLLKIPRDYPLKYKFKNWLKLNFLRIFSTNTTDWIVQTDNTAKLVRANLALKKQNIHKYPFYFIPKNINRIPVTKRTDYAFIGEHTQAKGHEYLLTAWIELSKLGIFPVLHLTVTDLVFTEKITEATAKGVKIINHGRIKFDEVMEIYNLSKAIVYPSLNESLGLGIVEAMSAGCDVIGCNLPYLHSVCKASKTFAPRSSESIVRAVLAYENGEYARTVPLIRDMVEDFVSFINK